jgi:GH24 family phage-related lysozyme (muramidase)
MNEHQNEPESDQDWYYPPWESEEDTEHETITGDGQTSDPAQSEPNATIEESNETASLDEMPGPIASFIGKIGLTEFAKKRSQGHLETRIANDARLGLRVNQLGHRNESKTQLYKKARETQGVRGSLASVGRVLPDRWMPRTSAAKRSGHIEIGRAIRQAGRFEYQYRQLEQAQPDDISIPNRQTPQTPAERLDEHSIGPLKRQIREEIQRTAAEPLSYRLARRMKLVPKDTSRLQAVEEESQRQIARIGANFPPIPENLTSEELLRAKNSGDRTAYRKELRRLTEAAGHASRRTILLRDRGIDLDQIEVYRAAEIRRIAAEKEAERERRAAARNRKKPSRRPPDSDY